MDAEIYLTLAAIAFELGIPVAAMVILVRVPRFRRFATVVLGAVTPFVLFYGFVTVSYLLNPSSKENVFSFYAMWVMTFMAYAALTIGGMLLALIPKPSNSYVRFLLGCASAPASYAVLKFVF